MVTKKKEVGLTNQGLKVASKNTWRTKMQEITKAIDSNNLALSFKIAEEAINNKY